MGFGTLVPADGLSSDWQTFASRYLAQLRAVLNVWRADPHAFAAKRLAQVKAVNSECVWPRRAEQWEVALRDAMLARGRTIEKP